MPQCILETPAPPKKNSAPMQFILDHIASILIGSIVLLVIVGLMFQGNEAMVDQPSYYAAKAQTRVLTEMIEADFGNVGLGVPPGTDIVNEATATATEFLRLIDPDDTVLATVRYEMAPVDTVMIDGQEVPLYEVQRLVNGAVDGKSPARMSEFQVEFRDLDGTPVADPTTAKAIHVQFTMIPPFTEKGYLNQTHWGRTFRSPNL